MTLKALDILVERSNADGTPFMMMSEAASIDKAMHIGDYHRALGDLLEFDNVVGATLDRLEELGIKDETLVVVTAGASSSFPLSLSGD
jgi:alkaline phosphatase